MMYRSHVKDPPDVPHQPSVLVSDHHVMTVTVHIGENKVHLGGIVFFTKKKYELCRDPVSATICPVM